MTSPLRFGILGAAGITPTSLVAPARDNPCVELVAVAARDRERADAFASEHGVGRAEDSYEALLAAPDVDAVYIALPNSEHARWTLAAVDSGKHVLVEKPFASNAEEAQRVAEHVSGSDRIVMEAFHHRHHPLFAEVMGLVLEGAIGDLVDVSAWFDVHLPDRSNIRYNYELAGGATMDLGCYPLHLVRSIVGAEPEIVSATYRPSPLDARIDEALTAKLVFPGGVTSTVASSLLEDAERQSATVTGTLGVLQIEGFVKPQGGNSLTLTREGSTTTIDVPEEPTSYACQLGAFLSAVRGVGPVLTGPEDAVRQMRAIDAMYRAAGLEPRPAR